MVRVPSGWQKVDCGCVQVEWRCVQWTLQKLARSLHELVGHEALAASWLPYSAFAECPRMAWGFFPTPGRMVRAR